MPQDRPTDLAREAMAKAAEEVDKNTAAAETEADLWRQCAEHLRRGELAKANEMSGQATTANKNRSMRHASRLLQFIETADPEFFLAAQVSDMQREAKNLSVEDARSILRIHELICGRKDCPAHIALLDRIKAG